MVNRSLKKVIEKVAVGASVKELCELGDSLLTEETGKVFKKEKEMKKGIAFPTCISVNNCICHFSPLKSDNDVILQDGDMVKIDLGAHLHGFIAVAAHTLVVGSSSQNKVTGRKADVIMAAHLASQAALRLVKPGNENSAVTESITKAAVAFDCKPIEGMLSHELKQHKIDGDKAIIQNPNEAQKKEHEKCEFDVHEVYAIDVIISTGEGKGREQDTRTTVYKKTEETYQLKMKTSRAFFSEVDKKFGTMPFTLRASEDEKKARMGVIECVSHKLLEPFNVLYEREGEFVAQFKFTVLLMPNGPMRITAGPFDADIYKSEKAVTDEDLKAILSTPANRKAAKKKKKKAEKQMLASGAPPACPAGDAQPNAETQDA
ncbi:PREDICTED: proliferation-associated protein 2G4-like [Priapulus caudatus]|uniref:Proliferation-associated protein 2G4-like n=1 Tax=Priapulus caudatus TaxID=37621 RepID=A0ABM1F7J8_PRICU|nr:PREDICTED: proliferation-associated protein 2G4-like [Priapulus caudatus]